MVVRAREIMTSRVATVRVDAPLALVEQRFRETRHSALPVVDRIFRLVGIISVVDVLRHRADPDATVGSVMTTDVLTMSPNANVGILAHRLRTYGEFRVMPIVDRGVLVGVVTRSDLLRPRRRRGLLDRLVGRRDVDTDPFVGPAPLTAEEQAARASRRLVREAMTSTGLVTATAPMPVAEAAALLTRHRFTALPVVDGAGDLVGIVSEADLLRDPLDGRRTRATTVGAAMARNVVTVSPDDPLDRARELMTERGYRLLPVVVDGRLVGMVSRRDLL